MMEQYKVHTFPQVEDLLDKVFEGVEVYTPELLVWEVSRVTRQLQTLEDEEHFWLLVSRLGVTAHWSEFAAGRESFGFNPDHKLAVYDVWEDEGVWRAQRIH